MSEVPATDKSDRTLKLNFTFGVRVPPVLHADIHFLVRLLRVEIFFTFMDDFLDAVGQEIETDIQTEVANDGPRPDPLKLARVPLHIASECSSVLSVSRGKLYIDIGIELLIKMFGSRNVSVIEIFKANRISIAGVIANSVAESLAADPQKRFTLAREIGKLKPKKSEKNTIPN